MSGVIYRIYQIKCARRVSGVIFIIIWLSNTLFGNGSGTLNIEIHVLESEII